MLLKVIVYTLTITTLETLLANDYISYVVQFTYIDAIYDNNNIIII